MGGVLLHESSMEEYIGSSAFLSDACSNMSVADCVLPIGLWSGLDLGSRILGELTDYMCRE